MKYIGTNCFPNHKISTILKEKLNDKYNHHNQFRIVCKARGIKHANELTSWVAYNAFKYDYCSETGNKKELSFFENNSNINFIICGRFDKYITDIELKELLENHPAEKAVLRNKKLGKFTKTIYDETFDFSKCPECCTQITDEQANDENFINEHHIKDLLDCVRCFGCPAAKGGAE